jgi:hypothetical protein
VGGGNGCRSEGFLAAHDFDGINLTARIDLFAQNHAALG